MTPSRVWLTPVAEEALTGAIAAIEGASAAEVVVAVRPSAASWMRVPLAFGVLAAWATLAFMLFGDPVFPLWSFLVDPVLVAFQHPLVVVKIVVGVIVGGFVALIALGALGGRLVPKSSASNLRTARHLTASRERAAQHDTRTEQVAPRPTRPDPHDAGPTQRSSPEPIPAPSPPTVTSLAEIAKVDPDFSAALFEDFAFRLYGAAHRSRGEGTLDELAPYLGPEARRALAARPPVGESVTAVVVGSVWCTDVQLHGSLDGSEPFVSATLVYEANYSIGRERRFAVEEWSFRRVASARTPPPTPGRRFPCPKCGASWQSTRAAETQRCASCGEVVGPAWRGLVADDPAVTAQSIGARLEHIYAIVNDGWAARDLTAARAVLSDGLADYLRYWLDAYAQQGLHNVLEDMRITDHVMVKLRRDRHYDALTIRLWASGRDYVIRDADGSHVRGSRTLERDYSEYWTLLRSSGRRGAARVDQTCGGCGAPLTVTMARACAHCDAHVTAGEFDWVLSKIEQGDAYRG